MDDPQPSSGQHSGSTVAKVELRSEGSRQANAFVQGGYKYYFPRRDECPDLAEHPTREVVRSKLILY